MNFSIFIFCTITIFACYFANTFEEEAFSPDQGSKFDFSFVDDRKNFSLVHNLDAKAKLYKQYATKSGYKIGIYDDIFTTAHCIMLRGLTTYKLGEWSYRISEDNVHGGQKHVSPNDIPWSNEISAVDFSETIVGKQLQKVVMDMAGGAEGVYVPYKVVGHIIRCGDSPRVHVDATAEEDEMSMIVYLNERWRKNDYGDLYLYDDNKEIVAGVIPRYGRVIVWQSSIPYLPRPPSVAYKGGQLFLHIRFTKNETKFTRTYEKWLEYQKHHKTIQNNGLFLKREEDNRCNEGMNVETKLISEAKSKQGKRIFVFDGLFSKDVLDHLRSVILNYGVYYYDDSYDEESDNVQWIAGFDVDKYVQSRMWGITRDVATFVSGGHTDWFPYDVSCNLIRNADTTQIHTDCSTEEDEWTFLLYLNPEWGINDYGETVFYEENNDNTEIITEVLPKYGRVVIFQGIIPHSARPPSRNFTGARLSFAVKLSINEWAGRHKAFREEMRHLTGVSSMLYFMKLHLNGNESSDDEDDSNPDPLDADFEPSMNDSDLQEMEERLQTLTDETSDMGKLRNLFKEVQSRHDQARGHVGELIRQLL